MAPLHLVNVVNCCPLRSFNLRPSILLCQSQLWLPFRPSRTLGHRYSQGREASHGKATSCRSRNFIRPELHTRCGIRWSLSQQRHSLDPSRTDYKSKANLPNLSQLPSLIVQFNGRHSCRRHSLYFQRHWLHCQSRGKGIEAIYNLLLSFPVLRWLCH